MVDQNIVSQFNELQTEVRLLRTLKTYDMKVVIKM